MQKILIILAHPAIHKSKINKALLDAVSGLEGVTLHDLYENYPDFFINIKKEQSLLGEHDIIVWQHPLYWYSCPALLKEWFDLVLEHDFAYGKNGTALHGKKTMTVTSTGGSSQVYSESGLNHNTIHQFLIPFRQTALLCGMEYLPPFVVHGAHSLMEQSIRLQANKYRKVIVGLRDERFSKEKIRNAKYIYELIRD